MNKKALEYYYMNNKSKGADPATPAFSAYLTVTISFNREYMW